MAAAVKILVLITSPSHSSDRRKSIASPPLPSPAKQINQAEAGSEERECGREWGCDWSTHGKVDRYRSVAAEAGIPAAAPNTRAARQTSLEQAVVFSVGNVFFDVRMNCEKLGGAT
jgi:hypothetical protein